MTPVLWQRVESVAIVALVVVGAFQLDFAWWWLLVVFLAFDLSALFYLANTRIGAAAYNAVHNYTPPALLFVAFLVTDVRWLAFVALAWAFHVAVDRALGYGLKHDDDFQHTHLGWIGKGRKPHEDAH
jgi:hypothetical protein